MFVLEAPSPEEIRQQFDSPAPVILTGDDVQMVFFETDDHRKLSETADRVGYEVRSMSSIVWRGQPVCDIRSQIRIPATPSMGEVQEVFPDAVRISQVATAGSGRFWSIFSRYETKAEISSRLDELQIEEESASVILYSGCNRSNS
ncbi:hypothetical protein ACFR9U_01025 [Halorientalis brevis]|uniref:Uncharacterized protein n=2 Tax=Halorientalis brevis TaxID=1126241 RepID=A0ABD6C6S0_9EURY